MEGHHRRAYFLHAIRKTNVLASAHCEAFAAMVCRLFPACVGPCGWHVRGNIDFPGDIFHS